MKRKMAVMLAITALISVTVAPALAEEMTPIEDFRVVKNFPSDMVAGLTYEAIYQFRNSAMQSIPIQVCLKIIHPKIEKGEWYVKMDSVNMNEVSMGIFLSDICYVEARTQFEYSVTVSSLPLVIPAEYTFMIELWSGSVRVYPPKEVPSDGLPTPIPIYVVSEEPTFPSVFWILILLAATIMGILSLKVIYERYESKKGAK